MLSYENYNTNLTMFFGCMLFIEIWLAFTQNIILFEYYMNIDFVVLVLILINRSR